MPTSTGDAALRARIESFTADLANIVRAAALEAVTTALGGAPTAPVKRGPGRPVKSGTPSQLVAPKRTGKRAKRTPKDAAEWERSSSPTSRRTPASPLSRSRRRSASRRRTSSYTDRAHGRGEEAQDDGAEARDAVSPGWSDGEGRAGSEAVALNGWVVGVRPWSACTQFLLPYDQSTSPTLP